VSRQIVIDSSMCVIGITVSAEERHKRGSDTEFVVCKKGLLHHTCRYKDSLGGEFICDLY